MQEAKGGWLPPASAPKGHDILIYAERLGAVRGRIQDGALVEIFDPLSTTNPYRVLLTQIEAWMPLPAAPDPSIESTGAA